MTSPAPFCGPFSVLSCQIPQDGLRVQQPGGAREDFSLPDLTNLTIEVEIRSGAANDSQPWSFDAMPEAGLSVAIVFLPTSSHATNA